MTRARDLGELLADQAREADVLGAQVALLDDGEVLTASTGWCDADQTRPMTDEVSMPVASVTKPLVATLVVMLAQEGVLTLDDRVGERVPELAASSWANAATIRQLLANTSGVPLRQGREYVFPADGPDAFALYATDLAADPPLTPPGTMWGYQNTGWNLLGRVIEVATGMLWEEAMRSYLFGPLGMGSARFFHEGDLVAPSECFEVRDGQRTPASAWANRANGPGGAGLWSTARDLIRSIRPHVETDAFAILRETHASPPVPNFLDHWCLGMARFDHEGGPVWGWDGVGPGHRSILRFIPGRGAIALQTNTSTGRRLYRSLFPELLDRWFGIQMHPPLGTSPDPVTSLDRFEGTYAWLDTTLEVATSEETLTLSEGPEPTPLQRLGDATFTFDADDAADATITFAHPDPEGRPQMLYYLVWPFPRAEPRPRSAG